MMSCASMKPTYPQCRFTTLVSPTFKWALVVLYIVGARWLSYVQLPMALVLPGVARLLIKCARLKVVHVKRLRRA